MESALKQKEKFKVFFYKGTKYKIDSSKRVDTMGDFFENEKIIYIDKNIPEEFHEGIAVHEIEERKVIKKGNSYGWSHNVAQKKELEFFKKKYGEEKGEEMMKKEEEFVLNLFIKYTFDDLEEIQKKNRSFVILNKEFKE